MRFLIGLVSGAAVVLLLAPALDGTDRGWLERAPAWFDELATSVGDALALPPGPAAEMAAAEAAAAEAAVAEAAAEAAVVAHARAQTQAAAAPTDAAASSEEQAAAQTPGSAWSGEPATQPIPRPPDPRPMDGMDDEPSPGAENVQDIVQRLFGDPRPSAAAQAAGAGGDTTTPIAPPALAAAADDGAAGRSAQPVWVPFHSRLSASGFAERLSESLDHPFRVERRGPGRYQVVFAYRDEPQRLAVLAEAAAATGLPL